MDKIIWNNSERRLDGDSNALDFEMENLNFRYYKSDIWKENLIGTYPLGISIDKLKLSDLIWITEKMGLSNQLPNWKAYITPESISGYGFSEGIKFAIKCNFRCGF